MKSRPTNAFAWRRAISGAALLVSAALLSGCVAAGISPPPRPPYTTVPIEPPKGFLWTHFRAPLILPGDADLGTEPISDHSHEIYVRIPTPYVPTEISFGKVDIANAARKAGIKRLVHVDYEFRSFLIYFKRMTIHAYGFAE